MDNREEVIIFLEGVKTYLYGDLSNFDRLCKEAEDLEKLSAPDSNDENVNYINSFDPNIPNTSTTSKQTTSLPNSIDSLDKETIFFRSTIPHILSILATADLVGFLLGNLKVTYAKNLENMENFYLFLPGLTKTEIKYLTIICRNGMAHTFFPKKKFGIKAHSSNPKNKLFFPENDTIILNANYLIEFTKQILDEVLSNSSNFIKMQKQFDELKQFDDSKIDEMNLEIFKKGLL